MLSFALFPPPALCIIVQIDDFFVSGSLKILDFILFNYSFKQSKISILRNKKYYVSRFPLSY